MENTIESINSLRFILHPIFSNNPVMRAAVFGSYAKGTQNSDSDIDLLVEFDKDASLLDLGGLFEDIKEAVGREIDIITYHSLSRESSEFADNVLQEAQVIYECK